MTIQTIITNNRASTVALKVTDFETANIENAKITFANWKKDIEALRIAVSAYTVLNKDNSTLATSKKKTATNNVYNAYKKVLSYLTLDSETTKKPVRPCQEDLTSFVAIIGTWRKDKDTERLEFLPVGATVFRKGFEKFLASRILNETSKTAEMIEAERKARNEKKKEDNKAKRLAEKAGKVNISKTIEEVITPSAEDEYMRVSEIQRINREEVASDKTSKDPLAEAAFLAHCQQYAHVVNTAA